MSRTLQKFGLVPVVCDQSLSAPTREAEIQRVRTHARARGRGRSRDHWARAVPGPLDLARAVVETIEAGRASLKLLYPDDMPLIEKIRTIAREIYRAKDIAIDEISARSARALRRAWATAMLPVCIAKTQYSFSTNPDLKGAPVDHTCRCARCGSSAGAEFVVAICGDIMTMPGLPRVRRPPTRSMSGPDGKIMGLF